MGRSDQDITVVVHSSHLCPEMHAMAKMAKKLPEGCQFDLSLKKKLWFPYQAASDSFEFGCLG